MQIPNATETKQSVDSTPTDPADRGLQIFGKCASVLNMFRPSFLCHYSLNSRREQLFTKHLHCMGYYKSSQDDLEYSGGCAYVLREYCATLYKGLAHPWTLVAAGHPGTCVPQKEEGL